MFISEAKAMAEQQLSNLKAQAGDKCVLQWRQKEPLPRDPKKTFTGMIKDTRNYHYNKKKLTDYPLSYRYTSPKKKYRDVILTYYETKSVELTDAPKFY